MSPTPLQFAVGIIGAVAFSFLSALFIVGPINYWVFSLPYRAKMRELGIKLSATGSMRCPYCHETTLGHNVCQLSSYSSYGYKYDTAKPTSSDEWQQDVYKRERHVQKLRVGTCLSCGNTTIDMDWGHEIPQYDVRLSVGEFEKYVEGGTNESLSPEDDRLF